MSEYLSYRLGLKNGTQSKPEKVSKPIPKRSEKMKGEMKKYKPAMIDFLKKNKLCKLKFDGCQVFANCVHHVRGRIGKQLHKQEDWLPSCGWCNGVAEIRSQEAKDKGVVKSRLAIL